MKRSFGLRAQIYALVFPLFISIALLDGCLIYQIERNALAWALKAEGTGIARSAAEFLKDSPMQTPENQKKLARILKRKQARHFEIIPFPEEARAELAQDRAYLKLPRGEEATAMAYAPLGQGRALAVEIDAQGFKVGHRMIWNRIYAIALFILLLGWGTAEAIAKLLTRQLQALQPGSQGGREGIIRELNDLGTAFTILNSVLDDRETRKALS